MNKDFLSGLTFWIKGWAYLFRHPLLLLLAITPMTLAVAVAVYAFINYYDYLPNWMNWFYKLLDGFRLIKDFEGPIWKFVIYYPLFATAVFVGIIGIFFTVYCFHSLIAIPFYSWIAEKTIQQEGKDDREPITLWRVIKIGAVKTLVLAPFGAFMLAMSFVPVFNLFSGALLFLAWAYDILEFSFEAAGFGLRDRIEYVSRHPAQWIGMATGLALTLLIPTLTLLVVPGAIAGAALILKVDDDTRSST